VADDRTYVIVLDLEQQKKGVLNECPSSPANCFLSPHILSRSGYKGFTALHSFPYFLALDSSPTLSQVSHNVF
jgi:hypothetical protein